MPKTRSLQEPVVTAEIEDYDNLTCFLWDPSAAACSVTNIPKSTYDSYKNQCIIAKIKFTYKTRGKVLS